MAMTPTIRLTQPTIGGDEGPIWPQMLNDDMTYTDRAINGVIAVNVPDANVTLDASGGDSDQARYAGYYFTGSASTSRLVTLPANQKFGIAFDGTTGSGSVSLRNATGPTLQLTDSYWTAFYSDGAGVYALPRAFGDIVLTGALTMPNNVALRLRDSGGTARDVLYENASNQLNLRNAGTGLMRFLNQAGTVLMTLDNSGGAAIPGYMAITGSTLIPYASYGYLTNAASPAGQNTTPGSALYGLSVTNRVLGLEFNAYSDERLKEKVETIPPAEGRDWVLASRPVSFTWKADGHWGTGFIAQEQIAAGYVQDIRPGENGTFSLNYMSKIAYLTAALQDAFERIRALEEKYVGVSA